MDTKNSETKTSIDETQMNEYVLEIMIRNYEETHNNNYIAYAEEAELEAMGAWG